MADQTVQFRIVIRHKDGNRGLAYISLLNDGSISVGLLDRSIKTDCLSEQSEDDPTRFDVVHRIAEPLNNPHMTFHPAGFVHLRSPKQEPIYQGLTWTDNSPWIRFTSNPLHTLKAEPRGRHGQDVRILPLDTETLDFSAHLMIDFVSRVPAGSFDKRLYRIISWKGVSIAVYVRKVPPQSASLGFVFSG